MIERASEWAQLLLPISALAGLVAAPLHQWVVKPLRFKLNRFVEQMDEVVPSINRMSDILDQLQSSAAITNARTQLLINCSQRPMWEADSGGKNTSVNQRLLDELGYASGDLLGDGWLQIIHPEDRDRVTLEWRTCVAEQRRTFHAVCRLVKHYSRGGGALAAEISGAREQQGWNGHSAVLWMGFLKITGEDI